MIILDTNILSALMRSVPDKEVIAWLDQQPQDSVWITTITLFEARLGLELLPNGKRKQGLEEAFEAILIQDLENRVLELDGPAADAAASLAAQRQRAGNTVDMRDTFIAGIALSRRATIATRNVRHFEGLSIQVVNPWEAV